MTAPLIEVIESCKADIARFQDELKEIIAEADEDGIRDDDEKKEIENFEASIADLTQFVEEKEAEFKRNESEWNALSSDVSVLMSDFLALQEWGTPGLAAIDQQISTMDENANQRFYRDAIDTYKAVCTAMDPLVEEYNRQSAAKLDYDEAMDDAWRRVEACRQAEVTSPDIASRLDQIETDFDSCSIMAEQLNYEGALSALQPTIDEIGRVEGMIEEQAATKKRLDRAFADMLTKRTDAFEQLDPFTEVRNQLLDDCVAAEATFNALMNDNYFEQAELHLQQMEETIAAAVARIPTLQAEQEALEADQALMDKERDQLAAQLSATAPEGTFWRLHEWQEGDSFDDLASTCQVKGADILLGHPNNSNASDYYNSNGELPAGTLVCVVDPSVEVYKITINGQEHYLTKPELDRIGAGNTQMMNAIALSLKSTICVLRDAHDRTFEARNSWAGTIFLQGFGDQEPRGARNKAEAHEDALTTFSLLDQSQAFADAVTAASTDVTAWHDALKNWLDQLLAAVEWRMDVLWWADVAAKTTATALGVTVMLPIMFTGAGASAAIYTVGQTASAGAATGALLSVYTDTVKFATAKTAGLENAPTFTDVVYNAAFGAAVGGVTAGCTAFFMKSAGPEFLKSLGNYSDFSRHASEIVATSPGATRVANEMARRAAQVGLDRVPTVVTDVAMKTLLARFTVGSLKNLLLQDFFKALKAWGSDVLGMEEQAAMTIIVDRFLTDEVCVTICVAVIAENEAEFEAIVMEEFEKHLDPVPATE